MSDCTALRPVHATDCTLEDWLGFLGHRWNALLLWQLSGGPRRFSDLQSALSGITPKVLTERLAALLERGLILRTTANGFPREVRYSLAPRGKDLAPILTQLYGWSTGTQ